MHSGSELVCVQLVKSICLPILLYAIEAVQPARSTLLMLDNILNRSVFRIFGCSNADDICFIRAMTNLACIEDIANYRHRMFLGRFASSVPWASAIVHTLEF